MLHLIVCFQYSWIWERFTTIVTAVFLVQVVDEYTHHKAKILILPFWACSHEHALDVSSNDPCIRACFHRTHTCSLTTNNCVTAGTLVANNIPRYITCSFGFQSKRVVLLVTLRLQLLMYEMKSCCFIVCPLCSLLSASALLVDVSVSNSCVELTCSNPAYSKMSLSSSKCKQYRFLPHKKINNVTGKFANGLLAVRLNTGICLL